MIKLSLKMDTDTKNYLSRTLGSFRFLYNQCIDIFLLEGRMPEESDLDTIIKLNPKQFSYCGLTIAKEKALTLFHEDRIKSNNFREANHNRLKDLYLTRNDVNFIEFTKECSKFSYNKPTEQLKEYSIIIDHNTNGRSFFTIDPVASLKEFREQFLQSSLDILQNLKFSKVTIQAYKSKAKGFYLILE